MPYQPFARPIRLSIAIGNDRQFARLADMCGHPEWAADARFQTNGARVANRSEIVRLVAECIATRPAAEWFEELDAAGIPAGPINRIWQALTDVQAQHRAVVRTISGVPLVGSPVRIDGARADSELPPPRLGEHTRNVLQELGLSPDEVTRLQNSGVVG